MTTFALITEGITDQVVLERLIDDICASKFDDDIEFVPIQPERDATDAYSAPHGGWALVLEACELRAAEALEYNNYLIVQIDTDLGDDKGYGLGLSDGGIAKSVSVLISDAKNLLASRIGKDVYDENSHRICFAICIHSIESWLLILAADLDHVHTGEARLSRYLKKIDFGGLRKTYEGYGEVCDLVKSKRVKEFVGSPTSLGQFLDSLSVL
ncbi:MAG: hypothetical protein ACK4MH_01460 [Brevundimonas sp.]|uniref:hypothetical protein n=1 Tax=Brevundimonas sp. TaxID=1871086 RepID=UPI0039187A0E